MLEAVLPVTDHVTVCAGLLVPSTVALNCCVFPFSTEAVEGFTVTDVTVGGWGGDVVTVTEAVPDLVASTVEVAFTVKLVAVSPEPTDNTPLELMLEAVLPVTDHVTVWAGLLVPSTVALNCWVFPFSTEVVEGLTDTPVTTLAEYTLIFVFFPPYPTVYTPPILAVKLHIPSTYESFGKVTSGGSIYPSFVSIIETELQTICHWYAGTV
jgi:hypothetical protein